MNYSARSRCVHSGGPAQIMIVTANWCDPENVPDTKRSAKDAQGQDIKEINSSRSVNSWELASYRSVDGLSRNNKLPPLPRKQPYDNTLMESIGGNVYCDSCRAKLITCTLCHKPFADDNNYKHGHIDSSECAINETNNEVIIGNTCCQHMRKRSKGKRIGLARKLRGCKVKHSDDHEVKADIHADILKESSNLNTSLPASVQPLNAYYIDTGTVPPTQTMSVTADSTGTSVGNVKVKPPSWSRTKSSASISSRELPVLENVYHKNMLVSDNAPLEGVTHM